MIKLNTKQLQAVKGGIEVPPDPNKKPPADKPPIKPLDPLRS